MDFVLAETVNETISSSPIRPKPSEMAARAASVARPLPQVGRLNRHPISTAGVKLA